MENFIVKHTMMVLEQLGGRFTIVKSVRIIGKKNKNSIKHKKSVEEKMIDGCERTDVSAYL